MNDTNPQRRMPQGFWGGLTIGLMAALAVILVWWFFGMGGWSWGQRHGSDHMMHGRCPMCGQAWQGEERAYNIVPRDLPRPKNEEWLGQLREVLGLERLSKAQYQRDMRKYDVTMPYGRIIPQETNHINWIEAMFEAYGMKPDGEVPPVVETSSLAQALDVARRQEGRLIKEYQGLITRAEDDGSRQVLDTLLMQTEMHQIMFAHAARMGWMATR